MRKADTDPGCSLRDGIDQAAPVPTQKFILVNAWWFTMLNRRRMSLVAAGIAFVAATVVAMETVGKGVSISEMDWNDDGITSIPEFFSTMDVGVYAEEIDGKQCRRVFRTKDGAPIRQLCP